MIGDADKDGQAGVERKLHHLKHFCPAETWRLPYDVEPKHGKDLRDWLTDGHTLAELLDDLPNPEPRDASLPPASASQPKPESKGTARSDVDKLLESLDLHVAGRTEDGHLILWNGGYARWETVRNVDRFGFDSFCSMVGSRANDHIVPKAIEDDQRLPWSIARREIALRSAENTVAIDNRFGPGVWQARDENGHRIEGELAIVTREWAAIWDGSILTRLQAPFYRGMVLEIGSCDQSIHFEHLQQLLDQAADRQWVEGRFMDCTQMFASWRWVAQGEDPELVTALVVATFVQDVLEWCPQVVVVGESNTGKSYLLIALSSVFTSLCLKCSAHSTDAGLRQAIGNSCRPTLLDEWDSSKHRGQLLLMMRTASRGDARLVGTSYQKAQRSELKQMFWAAGITSGLTDQADQNRFIQIQLLPPKRGDEGKLQLRKPADLLSLGHELLAIGIRYGAEIAERARQIRESAPRDGTDSRILESYSVPAGVFAACLGLKASEAQEGLSSLLTSSGDQEVQSDQDALMDAILSQVVDAGGSLRKQSIAQLIRLAHVDQSEDAEKALVREGIAIDYDDDGEHLIAFGYRIIQDQLMKSTRWADKTINELLLRISTARLVKKKRFAGRRLTWVAIEFEHFNAVYGAGGQRNLL